MSKNNKKGNRYTKEFKDSVLKRLNQPSNETVTSIAEETSVPKGTKAPSTNGFKIITRNKTTILLSFLLKLPLAKLT